MDIHEYDRIYWPVSEFRLLAMFLYREGEKYYIFIKYSLQHGKLISGTNTETRANDRSGSMH